jgi:hypothetical protein
MGNESCFLGPLLLFLQLNGGFRDTAKVRCVEGFKLADNLVGCFCSVGARPIFPSIIGAAE